AGVAVAAGAGDLLRPGGGKSQGGADLVHGHLDDGAVVAVAGLVGAHAQPARGDDAGAAGQGLGDVLAEVAPRAAAHEEALAVLPLLDLLVVDAGTGGDREARHGGAGLGEVELGVVGQVADDGDRGLPGHEQISSSADQRAVSRLDKWAPVAVTKTKPFWVGR